MTRSVGVVCGVLVLLAGCGGDDSTPNASPAASSTVGAGSTTGSTVVDSTTIAPDVGSVASIEMAPCELVTSPEVAAATGLTVVAVDNDPVLPPNGCVFDVGVTAEVFVSIDDGQGRVTGAASMFEGYTAEIGSSAEPIPELGASAVYSSAFRTLAVEAGEGRFFAVGLSGGYPEELSEPLDALVALATAAIGRL